MPGLQLALVSVLSPALTTQTGQIGLLSNQLENMGNYSDGGMRETQTGGTHSEPFLLCLICEILIRFVKLCIKDESSLENI